MAEETLEEYNTRFVVEANRAVQRRRERKLIQDSEKTMVPEVPPHRMNAGDGGSHATDQRARINMFASNIIGRVWDPQRQRLSRKTWREATKTP
jgi:hypothetical protein